MAATSTNGAEIAIEKHPADVKAAEKPKGTLVEPEFDDEDPICFVRRNWGTEHIPAGKTDYVDDYTIVGGIGRNIPYGHAKKWLKTQKVGGYILPNNATIADIVKATGRNPEEPKNIAAAVQTMSADKIAAILGDEEAVKLARAILQQASQRRESDDPGGTAR